MEIIDKNNRRVLLNLDKNEVDISDGVIIEYTGIYYKSRKDKTNIIDIDEYECKFVGKIETSRGDQYGTTGIYIVPLYLFDNANLEWVKIDNYKPPKKKYFLYPHLLMLPDKYYHYKPLYFLHTCKPTNLDIFYHVVKTISLDNIE
jgi:hypothetical protein